MREWPSGLQWDDVTGEDTVVDAASTNIIITADTVSYGTCMLQNLIKVVQILVTAQNYLAEFLLIAEGIRQARETGSVKIFRYALMRHIEVAMVISDYAMWKNARSYTIKYITLHDNSPPQSSPTPPYQIKQITGHRKQNDGLEYCIEWQDDCPNTFEKDQNIPIAQQLEYWNDVATLAKKQIQQFSFEMKSSQQNNNNVTIMQNNTVQKPITNRQSAFLYPDKSPYQHMNDNENWKKDVLHSYLLNPLLRSNQMFLKDNQL